MDIIAFTTTPYKLMIVHISAIQVKVAIRIHMSGSSHIKTWYKII